MGLLEERGVLHLSGENLCAARSLWTLGFVDGEAESFLCEMTCVRLEASRVSILNRFGSAAGIPLYRLLLAA